MSFPAFNQLKFLLKPTLQRKESMSRSMRPIDMNIIVGTALRYLAGGSINDIRHIFKTSYAEAYNCVHCFIYAINESADFDIKLPTTAEEFETIRVCFKNKSSNSLMQGCVGAIDGFFQQINCPWSTEIYNSNAYYSGHYTSHGLNCQAMCDIRLKFLFFGVVAPGKTNDNSAYPLCKILKKFIENLPAGVYIVGDAAYTLTEKLLIPFTGSQKLDPKKDTFNFHLSQLRIRIEMAFGRLVRKFRILKRNLEGKLSTMSNIIMTCAKLHNFIIDFDMPAEMINEEEDEQIVSMPGAPLGMAYLPMLLDPEEIAELEMVSGFSDMRNALVNEIERDGLFRPDYNIARRESEMEFNIEREYFHL